MNMLEMLRSRGYSAKLQGTWYLAKCIEMQMREERPLAVTKEVYPALARAAGSNPSAVEKSIRDSIRRAEPGRTNAEVIRELSWGMRNHAD